tara:strand:+ start:2947 stop:3498 length:552 start_codon:yes stop_codon:yes gene_type:complete
MEPNTTSPAAMMVVRVRKRNQGWTSGPEASSPSFASPAAAASSPVGALSAAARCTTGNTRSLAREDDGDASDARRTAPSRPDRSPRVEEPNEAVVPTSTRAGTIARGPAIRTRAIDETLMGIPATAATRAAMTIGLLHTPALAALMLFSRRVWRVENFFTQHMTESTTRRAYRGAASYRIVYR